MKKVQIAFTLIELLVVIAIIGILSGLIIAGMNGMTQKATIAKAQVFSNSLRNSLLMNLVSEWKFDELTAAVQGSTIKDTWSGGNNGTLSTNSDGLDKIKTGTNCVSGNCLSFDGVDDYINCGTGNNLNLDTVTISAWVLLSSYYTTVHPGNYIVGTQWSYHPAMLIDNGYPLLEMRRSTDDAFVQYKHTSKIPLNTWTHIAVAYGNNNVDVYLNSEAKHFSSTYTPKAYSGYPFFMGTAGDGYYWFNGLLDDVRIYNNAAVPTSQIKEQYYSGLNSLFTSSQIDKKEYLERMSELDKNLHISTN